MMLLYSSQYTFCGLLTILRLFLHASKVDFFKDIIITLAILAEFSKFNIFTKSVSMYHLIGDVNCQCIINMFEV